MLLSTKLMISFIYWAFFLKNSETFCTSPLSTRVNKTPNGFFSIAAGDLLFTETLHCMLNLEKFNLSFAFDLFSIGHEVPDIFLNSVSNVGFIKVNANSSTDKDSKPF